MATKEINNQGTLSDRSPSDGTVVSPRSIRGSEALKREPALHLSAIILVLSALFFPFLVPAQGVPSAVFQGKEAPTWSVNLTGGFTSTFQMVLGSTFGPGQDVQDKLTAGVNNAFLKGDSVSGFAWSTTDLSNTTPNWQAGLLYKLPILRRQNQNLSLTVGGQRWLLPLVKTGSKDWLATGNLTYGTSVKRIPVFISEDSYSLVKSNLPIGSALYSQIYAQHRLLHRNGFDLALREGPGYTYSWGFYGCDGNRVFRYGGSLISSWKGATLEAMYRRQVALQDKIPDNGYWSLLLTKQFSGTFHRQ